MHKTLFTRRIGLVAALVLALTLACSTALAALSYPFITVTSDNVNLRARASSTATILERLDQGTTITVLGSSGGYYKVSHNNRTGYIMKQYVSTDAASIVIPTPTPVETVSGYPYDTVTNAKVNLRAKQSVYSTILKKVPMGATVSVQSVSGTFAKVNYNGTEGYIKTTYLNIKKVVKPTATPTPVPTLSPAENASEYQQLQKGSSGSHVKALQSALIELGFLSGKADGQFGDATEYAVLSFQSMNGYPTTGVADAILQAHLYSGKPKNSKGSKTEVKTLAPVDGVIVRLNNTGDLVTTIQTRLRELGYYTGEATGTYDKATRNAVKAFQKKNALKADGICGTDTQKLLLVSGGLSADATPTPKPTPTPTPVPTFTVPEMKVERGSSGNDAKLVQKRLKELGYYTGKVDGKFGSGSVKALKAFQTQHGLEADGIAGKSTYAILFSINALAAGATPTLTPSPTPAPPTPTPTPEPITRDNVVVIRENVTGDAVTRLQERLTQLGYYNATTDGVCKADDVAAIKSFQRKNGLKADGVAGYDTQSLLYSSAALTSTGALAGGSVDAFTTLRKGMTGQAVADMQKRLIELGYLTGEADGNYGRDTANAVYNFQKANKLSRDGVAGANTLSLLYSATAAAAKPTAAPNVSLRKGDVSDAVKTMQQRLIELGYLSGKADGKFGVQTYEALLAFQRANGLTIDGIAGSGTLNRLTSSSAIASGNQSARPTPTINPNASTNYKPTASAVRYANWYTEVKARCKLYPYATVYDFSTGISWQVHMFSLGAHADAEPLTAADTAKLERAFGGNTWNPKAVWVIFGDGRIYMASTHSMPHAPQHRTDNNFDGHLCIHFPRTADQVAAIGPYATSHQKTIDAGWKVTQSMIK